MARADTRTWLSLDRWAQVIGLNPLHFNQLDSTLFPNTVCGKGWFQHAWQSSDRVSREDVARAINQAEGVMAREAGFNLLPDWTAAEQLDYPRPHMEGAYGIGGRNPRSQHKSVELRKGHYIFGGVQARSVVEAGASYVRSDVDTDTFQETCTVTVTVDFTDPEEIRVYYPAKNGSDLWEVRPITASISGTTATITFKVWQIVAANQLERLDPSLLDADDSNNFESTVDVYRVYTDQSTQLQFLWEPGPFETTCCGSCVACLLSSQAGCIHARKKRLGFVAMTPASWDSDNEQFTNQEFSVCREPDHVRVWYYSGYEDPSIARPRNDLSPYWEYAVAAYAASLLDRDVCGCSNVSQQIHGWRRDAAFASDVDGTFQLTPEQASNRLGTTMGAVYAWKRINQNGVRVNK